MTIRVTYYIRYDNGSKSAWLTSTDTTGFENITEKELRTMLVADSGFVLADKDGNQMSESLWLKDISLSVNYSEVEPKDIEPVTPEP